MSIERARKTIHLEKSDKIAQWEHLFNPAYLTELTHIDALNYPRSAMIAACELLDLDFYADLTAESPTIFERLGQNVDLFKENDLEALFSFDPFKVQSTEYSSNFGIDLNLGVTERAEYWQKRWWTDQEALGSSVMVPICNWFTLIHGFSVLFGYEATFEAMLTQPKRFSAVLERFALASMKQAETFAQTDAELVLYHDDLGMSDRTIYSPDWCREHLFPWYREFWKPLKKAGKKIIFYSDGDIDAIMQDLIDTGIDGFFVDSCASLEKAVNLSQGRHFILGNANVVKMSYGVESEIGAEIQRCLNLGGHLPGYILSTSGQFLPDVPVKAVRTYFDLSSRMRVRKG